MLKFRFEPTYPIASPAVQFVVGNGQEAPVHPVCLQITRYTSTSVTFWYPLAHVGSDLACLLERSCQWTSPSLRPSATESIV